ncbi:MAG: M3 family metallopeptidase [Pacificimonas sp.]|jgi:peptidyl-dipeptidase Dcp|nr:M3 family metallopeptidase [Pacificimonas sp.]
MMRLITSALLAVMAAVGTMMLAPPVHAQAGGEFTYVDLADWTGPFGGLPPVHRATPELLTPQFEAAVADYKAELDAVANTAAPPSFDNTVAAIDRAGKRLRRLSTILQIFATTQADDDWRAAAQTLRPLADAVRTRALTDPAIFARVAAVYQALPEGTSDAEQARLTTLTYQAMQYAGAGLDTDGRARLAAIDEELAELRTAINQNLGEEAAGQFAFFTGAEELDGLPAPQLAAAADLAEQQGRRCAWAIPNRRPQVFAVQTHVTNRATREAVWRMWMDRGASDGALDNRPVTARILTLRAEKANLLGYPTYADYVLATRMVGSPEKALEVLDANWTAVMRADAARIDDLAALARTDGIDAIQPWDRIYYLERYKHETFGIDTQKIAAYFALPNIRDAFLAAATDSFGYRFEPLDGIATVSPDIEVLLASRGGKPAAVIYIDIRPRPEKQLGSWAVEYRRAGDLEPGELPVLALHSSPPPAAPGMEILLPFPYANVLFHEFGHILHTMSSTASYNGTAALTVPWDFVEVPSLLNERWLLSDETLDRLPHYVTGEAMPSAVRENFRASLQYEGVFSVNPEFMAVALTDLKLHLAADPPRDANQFQAALLAEYGFPASADPMMQATAAVHTWTRAYAANVYTYLWSDILAADLAEVFLRAEGGLHDAGVGAAYFDKILSRANRVPVEQAYREFHGRPPDEGALIRRFDLGAEDSK